MKIRIFLPLLILLLLCCASALAEEAEDITDQCKFSASPGKFKLTRMYDRDYRTAYMSDKQKNPYVELTAPKGSPICSLYVCFAQKTLTPWEVQAKRGGKWETIYESAGSYAHEYVVLPEGEEALRIKSKAEKSTQMIINEIFAFGESGEEGPADARFTVAFPIGGRSVACNRDEELAERKKGI